MNRKMLINAHRPEEVRVAIINEGILDQYEVSTADTGLYRGNIYRGIVASIQPSLDASFVDFGAEKHGLLRAEDVVPAATAHRKSTEGGKRPRIDQLLEKGRPVLVQVVRDGIAAKGALLTTNLSIAGRYLVLMPYEVTRGISRKLEDSETRGVMRERLDQLDVPEGFGVIARTNAGDQPKSSLNRDLSALLRLWKKVRSEASTGKGTRLLYSDQDLILQVLRDSLDASIDEVLVDNDDAHDKVGAYMRTFMPRAKTRLTRYSDRMPLFSRFQLEEQIDRIYQRKVVLPAGGSIVIDGTEALTAIDVNSGRSRKAGSQEDTAVNTNLEAAREVARQLRLRDIGGLLVVDFIDMRSAKNQREVERTLREAMKDDRAKFTVSRLSPNGLLEINRQRIKKELKLRTYRSCPTCSGTGSIASPELVGLNLLRRIETRAVTGRLKRVRVELHPELADALQNERRHELAALEHEFDIRIEIIAATSLHRSDEHVEWFQREDTRETPQPRVAAVTVADLSDTGAPRSLKKGPSNQEEATNDADETGVDDTAVRSCQEPPAPPGRTSAQEGGQAPGRNRKRRSCPRAAGDERTRLRRGFGPSGEAPAAPPTAQEGSHAPGGNRKHLLRPRTAGGERTRLRRRFGPSGEAPPAPPTAPQTETHH